MLKSRITKKYFDGKLSYNQIKSSIKLAVYGPEYSIASDTVGYSPAERLLVSAVVDIKKQVVTYRKNYSDSIGNTEILENALVQTFEDKVDYTATPQNVSNGEVSMDFINFSGRNYFLTTLLFNPLFIKEYQGKKGYIFGIPSRNNFVLAPLNNTKDLYTKLIVFALHVFQLYKGASKPILPDLFYYDNNVIVNIVKYNGDEPDLTVMLDKFTK